MNLYEKEEMREQNRDREMIEIGDEKRPYPYNIEDGMIRIQNPDTVPIGMSEEEMAAKEEDMKGIDENLRQVIMEQEKEDENERLEEDKAYKPKERDWDQPLPSEGEKCNLLLMKMFKLQGRLWSRPKEEMKICGTVRSNCCTYMDELVIIKLWNEYSKPHILEFVNKLVMGYRNILQLHYRLANISVKEIDFHVYESRTVKFEKTICSRTDDVAFLDFNKKKKRMNEKALDVYYKKDNTEDSKFDLLDQAVEENISAEERLKVKGRSSSSKKKKGKKGKKRRKLKRVKGKREIEDRLLEEVKQYHDWNDGEKERIHEVLRGLQENPDVGSPEERQLSEGEESAPERSLKSKDTHFKEDPMSTLMKGLQSSLERISSDPEIGAIIEKTKQEEQMAKDESMFKVKSANVEANLERARKRMSQKKTLNSSTLKLSKSETLGIQNANWLRREFERALESPVKKIHAYFNERRRKLEQIESKVEMKMAGLHAKLEKEGLSSKDYERMLKKFPKLSDFNLWVYKQVSKGKKKIEDMPQYIVYKENKLHKFLKKTKEALEDMLLMERDFLSKQSNVPVDNDFLYKFMKTVNKKNIPKIELPFYPDRKRFLPDLPKVGIPEITCVSYPMSFPRKFLQFNPAKFEYCYKTALKMRRFDAQSFSGYLNDVRESIIELVFLKKNIYCDVCEQKTQQFFDFESNLMYFDLKFCRALVVDFQEYIKWKNIIFIEYVDQMFNWIQCFETPAEHNAFPFQTFVARQRREIFFIRRCFETLHTPDYFKYCHFICKQFSYTGFDSFFIGKHDFLVSIFSKLVSFLRKMKFDLPRNYHKEIQRGHGQFKTSVSRADFNYATEMSDDKLHPFDKQNQRPTLPEFRKLHIDNGKSQRKADRFKGLDPRKVKQIYKTLHERTKNSKLHPVHGIVFEPVKRDVAEVDEKKLLDLSDDDSEWKKSSKHSSFFRRKERILATLRKKKEKGDDFETIANFEEMDSRDLDEGQVKAPDMPESPSQKSKFAESEEVVEFYSKIDTKLSPSELRTMYLNFEALNPIVTDGGTNFDLEIDELIPMHYKRITTESLGSNMLNVVVPIHAKDEQQFNEDIGMKFLIKSTEETDKDLLDLLYEKREEQKQKRLKMLTKERQKEVMNQMNPKTDYMVEFKNPNPMYQETVGDYANMPELNFLF